MGKRLDRARDFIRQESKKDDPDPLYFLYGEEGYLLDQAVETIVESAAPEGTDDFNSDTFRGRSVEAEDIRESCEMLPMMVDRRVVVVRDLQEMAISELEQLEGYFESPSETTCLVLHAHTAGDNAEIDLRKGVFRTLKSEATHCEFESLYDYEVGEVVEKHARDRGMRFSEEASAYLIEAVGTDIGTLDKALDKVDLYLGPSDEDGLRSVRKEDVEEITAHTRVRSIFDLTDALGERNYREALDILDGMLLAGKSPLMILHMIARHFRLVDKIHDPELRNLGKRDLASELGVLHWFVDDYKRHARTFSASEIADIREHLLEVDRSLKSTGLSDRTVLESLLYDICFRDAEAAHQQRPRR